MLRNLAHHDALPEEVRHDVHLDHTKDSRYPGDSPTEVLLEDDVHLEEVRHDVLPEVVRHDVHQDHTKDSCYPGGSPPEVPSQDLAQMQHEPLPRMPLDPP